MPEGKADRSTAGAGARRRAAANLIVALLLVVAIGAIRLRAELADAAGLALLAAVGVLALVSACLLFRSFLRR